MPESQIRMSLPKLWSLIIGEDVSETHTPTLVHFSRKQFGNTQKVIKTNSAKGSLAKVRINQRCPPICYSISLQKFQEVHYDSRKKSCIKEEEPKIILIYK